MNDFNPRKFLVTKGILMQVLEVGISSLILFTIIAIFAGMIKAWYEVSIFAFWFIFMIIYTLYVIKEHIPDRRGAVRVRSWFDTQVPIQGSGPGQFKYETKLLPHALVEKPVNLKQYILGKNNHNVLICGMPGSGKSRLTRYLLDLFADYQQLIFNYKNNDEYLHLGNNYQGANLGIATPDPFKDPEAFTSAFMVAFSAENAGIQLSYVEPIIRKCAKESKTWIELTQKINEVYRATKDKNKQAAIHFIITNIETLGAKQATLNIGNKSIVFDFTQLNRHQRIFYTEYLLRMLWEEIKTSKRTNTILVVDEAHHLTKGKYSIYSTVAKEIRAFGMLFTATQLYHEMEELKGLFDTQFIFKTTEQRDLSALRTLDPKLPTAVSNMEDQDHLFTDASYANHYLVIPQFKLYYTPKDGELDYNNEIIQIISDNQSSTSTTTAKPKPDLEQEVWTILSTKDMDYVSNIAKQIKKEHPEYIIKTRKNWDRLKYDVLNALNKLITEGSVRKLEKEKEKYDGKVMYFRTSKNISPEHKQMETDILAILKNKKIQITKVSKSGSRSAPDIETPNFDIELETGRKHGAKDLKERLEITAKPTVIILPNKGVMERYSKYKNKNVHVVILENFEEFLENHYPLT